MPAAAERFVMVDRVRARQRIQDSPLVAGVDGSATKGQIGNVVDVVPCDGLVFVDFGRGAIACAPDELVVVAEQARVRFSPG